MHVAELSRVRNYGRGRFIVQCFMDQQTIEFADRPLLTHDLYVRWVPADLISASVFHLFQIESHLLPKHNR